MDRLRRVTDLFIKGQVLDLGTDPLDGRPVLVWVQKLNTFEEEESRQDGLAARGVRLKALENDDSPEMIAVTRHLDDCSFLDLQELTLDNFADEDRIAARDDVDASEDWHSRLPEVERAQSLLDDDSVEEDDPRRQQVNEIVQAYEDAVEEALKGKREERRVGLREKTEEQIREALTERIRAMMGAVAFLDTKRTTEVFFSLRDCKAVAAKGRPGEWNHATCTHNRLLSKRAEVRELPEQVVQKVIQVLETMTVPAREAGNSDGPTDSSDSSGPQNSVEDSDPSGQKESPKPVLMSSLR